MGGGTRNIQAVFDLCPQVLKNVVGYRSHCVPYAGFQLLKVVAFDLVDNVIHLTQ
jgi:hypothetical protein